MVLQPLPVQGSAVLTKRTIRIPTRSVKACQHDNSKPSQIRGVPG